MQMVDFGQFGFGSREQYSKLSKMLMQMKAIQQISDVTAITPVYKDPDLIDTVKVRTPLFEELTKINAPESTYRWEKNSADTFGKFVAETNAATRFANQTGSYAESTVVTRLLSYVMNIGLLAQKNTAPYLDLVRKEQEIGLLAIRKAIERCLITGAPAAASDGGVTDALAFSGLQSLITTNVDNPGSAEAISLDKLDAQIDAVVDQGAREQDLIIITDTFTKTKIASLFYNTFNTPISLNSINAGLKVESYRQAPIFSSSYMPTTSGVRELFIIDRDSTVLAEFYPTSQLDLGRTQLSDDSIMFWMGALAVKDEPMNAWIKKIV